MLENLFYKSNFPIIKVISLSIKLWWITISTLSSNKLTLKRNRSLRENIPFERLFNPRAIAVIGAGKEAFGGGGFFIRILKDIGYEGPIYPVNPKYDGEIFWRVWMRTLHFMKRI